MHHFKMSYNGKNTHSFGRSADYLSVIKGKYTYFKKRVCTIILNQFYMEINADTAKTTMK